MNANNGKSNNIIKNKNIIMPIDAKVLPNLYLRNADSNSAISKGEYNFKSGIFFEPDIHNVIIERIIPVPKRKLSINDIIPKVSTVFDLKSNLLIIG